MTNGGGVSETDRCQRLTQQLGREVNILLAYFTNCLKENQILPSQYIQAHTILKSVAHKYENQPVLVLGGRPGVCRRVAQE
jgi:ribonucleotide monophosphatase NagD (HAD superfamily)